MATRDEIGEPSRRHCERSEAIQSGLRYPGLPRRFAPRNDEASVASVASVT